MSNSLAKAVRSGGITQQEARLTWLLLGFTWLRDIPGPVQDLAISMVWGVTPTHFFLHQDSNFQLGQYGSKKRVSQFYLLFSVWGSDSWPGSVICRSRLFRLDQLYWPMTYLCHFSAAEISVTTTELLLSINRCVRSEYQIKVDTHKSSSDESGTFPGKQSQLTAAVGRKVDSPLFPELNIFHRCFCASSFFLFALIFTSESLKRRNSAFFCCGSLSPMLNTHISPVVELFQQLFVQVGGADSSDLLLSDQFLQLLPGRLQISQTLAVPLQGPRGRDDNWVELRDAQRLAGFRIEDEKKRFKTLISLELGVVCVAAVTDSSPISTASLMEDWTGSHRNSFTNRKKKHRVEGPTHRLWACCGYWLLQFLLELAYVCLCRSWIWTWNFQFLPLFRWDRIRFQGNGTIQSIWEVLQKENLN